MEGGTIANRVMRAESRFWSTWHRPRGSTVLLLTIRPDKAAQTPGPRPLAASSTRAA